MRSFLFLNLAILLFLSACKEEENPKPANQVFIDGGTYTTVTIGTLTWTASNHAGPGGVAFDANNSRPEYGKYYTKTEVDAITLPEGWRIPTQEDYLALAQHTDIATIPSVISDTENIKKFISQENWNNVQGTNTTGFNAFPTGYIFSNSLPIDGDIAEFWTNTGVTLSIQEAGLDLQSLRMVFYQSNSPEYRFTVRFVKGEL